MTLVEVINNSAWLGALVGVFILILLASAALGIFRNADDSYQPIGSSAPPPPRTSPFAKPSPHDDGELGRNSGGGG